MNVLFLVPGGVALVAAAAFGHRLHRSYRRETEHRRSQALTAAMRALLRPSPDARAQAMYATEGPFDRSNERLAAAALAWIRASAPDLAEHALTRAHRQLTDPAALPVLTAEVLDGLRALGAPLGSGELSVVTAPDGALSAATGEELGAAPGAR